MSLPELPTPDPCLTRDQAINMILVSIAMEEMALSHVIEAESEKIKYTVDYLKKQDCCADIDRILEINESATKLIETIMDIQMILKKKMNHALEALPKPCPPPCTMPEPEKGCGIVLSQPHKHSAVFAAKPSIWCCGSALPLSKQPACCVGIGLSPLENTEIYLPNCSRFLVNFNLELIPLFLSADFVSVELELANTSQTQMTERYHTTSDGSCVTILGSIILNTPRNIPHSHLCIRLLSPCEIQIKSGRINIVEL